MSTFLSILILIGKILLVILGIILFLICLILFVPVRYHVVSEGGNTEDLRIRADVSVSWLFHFISYHISVRKGIPETPDGLSKDFRVFGISPKQLKKKLARKKKERIKEQKKKLVEELKIADPEKYEEAKKKALLKKQKREEELARKKALAEAEKKAREEAYKRAVTRRQKLEEYVKMRLGIFRRAVIAARDTGRYAFSLILYGVTVISISSGSVFWKLSDLLMKIRDMRDSFYTIAGFATDPRTQSGLALLFEKLKKLLIHMCPRKAAGHVDFDLGDPCTTGQALAAASAFFPIYGGRVQLNPGFGGEFYIDGDLNLKGRVFVVYILHHALTFILNRNVRYMYHFYKEYKEAG